MRKLLSVISIIALALNVLAYDVKVDGIYYNLKDGKSAFVTYGPSTFKYKGEVKIPSSFVYKDNSYNVIGIGDSAFYRCDKLLDVSIPSTVKEIGKSAFERCYYLKKVNIPHGVTVINDKTFECCWDLNEIMIPDGVVSIGVDAFAFCHLDSIEFPNSLKTIEQGAFNYCRELKKIKLPDWLKKIGSAAFKECYNLKKSICPKLLNVLEMKLFLVVEIWPVSMWIL